MLIYLIRNTINEKLYIGVTTVGIEKRWRRHLSKSEQQKNIPLYRAMKKHGVENFSIQVLDTTPKSKSEMYSLEKHYIKTFKTRAPLGYNATNGGEGGELLGEALLKMKASRAGKKTSEATKIKMSIANKGRKKPIGFGQAISLAKYKAVIVDDKFVYQSRKHAALALGISSANICAVIKGKRKSAGGHTFKNHH